MHHVGETIYGIGSRVKRLGNCIATLKNLFLLEIKLPIVNYPGKVERKIVEAYMIGESCRTSRACVADRAWKDEWGGAWGLYWWAWNRWE